MNLKTFVTSPQTLSIIVVTHLVLLGVHAAAHSMLGVVLSNAESTFVVVTMIVAPIVAVILLYTTHHNAGIWLLLASMLSSFIFGLVTHFIIPGADNTLTVPAGDWRPVFQITTVLLGVVEGIGSLFPTIALLRSSNR